MISIHGSAGRSEFVMRSLANSLCVVGYEQMFDGKDLSFWRSVGPIESIEISDILLF